MVRSLHAQEQESTQFLLTLACSQFGITLNNKEGKVLTINIPTVYTSKYNIEQKNLAKKLVKPVHDKRMQE